MCTAITLTTKDHYFGRNLDLEYSYDESIAITPHHYPLIFRKERAYPKHYAMIGTAYVTEGYPLYYDATNEKGLSMAGLSFPGNAAYHAVKKECYNVAPFELIPWVLGQCQNVKEARILLEKTNVIQLSFSKELPSTPLHFLVADDAESIVVEPMQEGLKIWNNESGVLTNNPPFPYQSFMLHNYMGLSKKGPLNRFSKELSLEIYSRGMGAIGLPGDLSSMSRFVRAAFVKCNVLDGKSEEENVSQYFHILGSVEQQKGCVQLENGDYEYTVYSSCCNTELGIYYYKTYENSRITAVDMHRVDLNGKHIIAYPMKRRCSIDWHN